MSDPSPSVATPLPISKLAFPASGFLLTAGTFLVAFNNEEVEPFERFTRLDAIVQVGFGTFIVVGWGIWILLQIVGMVRAGRFRLLSLFAIMWGTAFTFMAIHSINAYFHDIEEFVIKPESSAG